MVSSGAERGAGRDGHHLVKVFCWTLTHCCSSGAMFGVHQCSARGQAHGSRSWEAWICDAG